MPPVRVGIASSALTAVGFAASPLVPERRPVRLGLLTYCFSLAQKARSAVPNLPDYADPAVFINEAARIGASAIQIPFGVLSREQIRAVRNLAENLKIALESTVGLPATDSGIAKFASELQTLQELGITVARTVVFPGRRYEDLPTLEAYKAALDAARRRISLAEPIARRHGVRLAIENHKDQRIDERIALLLEFESEFIGACIDVGNNMALLENPVAVCAALLSWALTVHFKDQGVREYEDGFFLADVPLGQGCIDLPEVIRTIVSRKPHIHLQLELITRDPLKVPVLTDAYWATFPNVKAQSLSDSWASLKKHASRSPFPLISGLSPAGKAAAERRNIEESFRYAAEHLHFSI